MIVSVFVSSGFVCGHCSMAMNTVGTVGPGEKVGPRNPIKPSNPDPNKCHQWKLVHRDINLAFGLPNLARSAVLWTVVV